MSKYHKNADAFLKGCPECGAECVDSLWGPSDFWTYDCGLTIYTTEYMSTDYKRRGECSNEV